MKLEQQVVSLELAQKMKELGFKQESLFYWFNNKTYFHPYLDSDEIGGAISAYTVAELGEMLPSYIKVDGHEGWVDYGIISANIFSKSKTWSCRYECLPITALQKADTEADARAKTLIYLVENGLLKP